jgi:hypothetical protein
VAAHGIQTIAVGVFQCLPGFVPFDAERSQSPASRRGPGLRDFAPPVV